jgi:hypothetical protein
MNHREMHGEGEMNSSQTLHPTLPEGARTGAGQSTGNIGLQPQPPAQVAKWGQLEAGLRLRVADEEAGPARSA